MGYKCGTCNKEFDNEKSWVEHMVNEHNSPFVSGEAKLIRMSINAAVKSNNENVLKKLRDMDIIDAQNKEVVY